MREKNILKEKYLCCINEFHYIVLNIKYLGKATRVQLIYISPKWTIYKPWDISKVRNMSGIHQNVLYQPHCCIMTIKDS